MVDRSSVLQGTWWTPGNRENAVHGALAFNATGRGELSTSGVVGRAWFAGGIKSGLQSVPLPAVHGEVEGEPVSLLGCTAYTIFLDVGTISVLSTAVVKGFWVDDASDAFVQDAWVRVLDLSLWTKQTAVKAAIPSMLPPANGTPLAVYLPVDPQTGNLHDKTITLTFGYRAAAEMTRTGIRHVYDQDAFFHLKYAEPTSVETVRGDARKLQDLITFACGRFSPLISIQLDAAPGRFGALEDAQPLPHGTLELPTTWPPDPDAQVVGASEMLFTLDDIAFGDFVSKWFQQLDRFSLEFASLRAQYYRRDGYQENRLLAMISIVEETFRTLGFSETFITASLAKRARKHIRAALAHDPQLAPHARTIADQLDGRVTLDHRVREVHKSLGAAAVRLLGSEMALEQWLTSAKRSRNDIAHSGSTDRFDGRQLNVISTAAQALVELAILRELGFSEDQLLAAVSRRYGDLASRIKFLPDVDNSDFRDGPPAD